MYIWKENIIFLCCIPSPLWNIPINFADINDSGRLSKTFSDVDLGDVASQDKSPDHTDKDSERVKSSESVVDAESKSKGK